VAPGPPVGVLDLPCLSVTAHRLRAGAGRTAPPPAAPGPPLLPSPSSTLTATLDPPFPLFLLLPFKRVPPIAATPSSPSFSTFHAHHEHHFTPLASCPRSAAGGSPTPSEVKSPLSPTAPFGELPPPAIVALCRRPPIIPRGPIVLQDLIAQVTGHRNSPAASERRRTPSPLMSSTRHFGENRAAPPCPAPPWRPHGAHRQDLVTGRSPLGRRRVRHPARVCVVTAQPRRATSAGRNGSRAGPTVPGPWAKAGPALCPCFFLNFQFLLHFQKFI
jgi:hypothetical protein